VGVVTHQQDRLARLMLGYTESDIRRFISNLTGIEGTSEEVAGINEVLDFLDGLLVEGHY
jgi:hypothetical protein